jgi:hypothetical protein
VLVEAGGMRHVLGDVELACEDPATYSLRARGDLLRVRARVRRTALAHEEEFLDNALLRWFANHPRGKKFFSRATLDLETSAGRIRLDDAPIFDEEVVFGAAP